MPNTQPSLPVVDEEFIQITVSGIPSPLAEKLKARAKAEGRSLSAQVRLMLQREIENPAQAAAA